MTGMSVSAVSGVLISTSMPNFDLSFLGWVALVPLLLAIEVLPKTSPTILALHAFWRLVWLADGGRGRVNGCNCSVCQAKR